MIQNMKIKLEWEQEQQRLKEIQLAKEKELEEKRLQQEKREKELLDFLDQGGHTPEHLKTILETNPGKDVCPFFQKVSACRFFEACSRNHIRPGISKIILIPGFFSDISLQMKENEHGSDSSLEFEQEDIYQHYLEFFTDVILELEKCGSIRSFAVCCNHEVHLRGNVYVQYQTTREALKSYYTFNGRWYAGKQLSVEFCNITNWKSALCGLFFRKKCPKGNSCNFLHIFKNPKGLYMPYEKITRSERGHSHRDQSSSRKHNSHDNWDEQCSERKGWRWSESPERPLKDHRSTDNGNAPFDKRTKEKSRSRHRSSKRSHSRSRSRSKGRSSKYSKKKYTSYSP
ncbi:hypothetical protein ABEB36_002637 [Hypothenemus hampei]|uniref:C3H1-type domain-containing protein n=1 Tax=Hypothenemus hampei TaxID=57062 RepID=A0ABD1F742_HYPHA